MSPAKFRAFTDILFSESGIENVSEMISAKAAQLGKMDAYKGLDENALNDIAYSEVTAEMMETALTDTDVLSRISSRLQQTDKSLWGKIKDFLKGLVDRLKAAYQEMNPDSSIARLARQSIQSSENALNAFADAASDAIVNYNLQDGESVIAGTVVDRGGESVDYLNSNRVTDKKTLDFLNGQETVTTYKTMQLVDGKLYPPMAAVVAGSYEDHSVLGQWEAATEHPELIKLDKSGKPKFTLNKGKGKGIAAAYNPYMHSSNLVLNDQFSGAYDRPNLVTVECKVPVSELTSDYKAQYAKDSVGWHAWHTGTVAGALRQKTGIERQVLLSRWIMPVRILSDAEVAGMYAELLNGTGIAVPDNVVPPKLLTELKKAGVDISESGRLDWQKNSAQEGVRFSQREFTAAANQFSEEISQWDKDGRDGDTRFVLGSTGEVLQGLGAIESDIYMNSDKINNILQDHPEITLDEIRKIPQILNDPILILKSRNAGRGGAQNTRMVMFGSIKGQNGLPVMTVFDLRPRENHFVIDDMQKVTSAYTKTTDPVSFIKDSFVLYADKKRTTSLLRTIGFHMPIELLQSGYIGTISYAKQNVNIRGEKFSNVFQDEITLQSTRQSQEVKQALDDYRYQRDVEFKAMKAVYDAERSQIEQAHRREMQTLEDSYRGEAAKVNEKFVQLMRDYEKQGLSREKLEQKLSEQADKLAEAKGNAAYWKRQFNELLGEYDKQGRSIDRLENKLKTQQQNAKAKVENARKIEERQKLERVISDINRRLLSPTKTLYVPDSLQPAVTTAMQSIATIQQQGAAETHTPAF